MGAPSVGPGFVVAGMVFVTLGTVTSGEPAHVAKYAFQLAQAFNNFYHSYPVLTEEIREKRTFLLWMTKFFQTQLERTLAVLGIAVPEYM